MFNSEASRILYIAYSSYSSSAFFSIDEWLDAKEAVRNRDDLIKRDKEHRRKTATNYGVI